MFSCFNLAALRASRLKRSSMTVLEAILADRTFRATSRPRSVSRALYTAPIPPVAMCLTTSYLPMRTGRRGFVVCGSVDMGHQHRGAFAAGVEQAAIPGERASPDYSHPVHGSSI